MAERVTITIDVDAKTAEIGKTIASLKALDATVNKLNSRTKRLSGSINDQDKSLKNLNKNFNAYNQQLNRAYRGGSKFNSIARPMLFLVVGLGIEFAAVALSLVSVNAAFNIGKLAVKGYHAALAGISGVVAAIGIGLSTAAAAQREYNASLYAFRMKSFPALGKGLNQSMAMLRNLTTDATMASFGMQSLNQAFASVSRSSEFTGRSLQVLRSLADFSYAGGDPSKNLAAAAEFVGLLQKEGKVTAEVTAAAKAMGPEFEKSFKKLGAGKKTATEIFGLITSGQMAKDAGVLGQAGVVGDTLMGTFKASITRMQALFADFGQQFLDPFRRALLTIEGLFRRTFEKIGPELQKFGRGPLLNFITNGAEKILNLSITLFRKYLPLLDGFGAKVGKFADSFVRSFRQLRDALEPLRKGGSIVIDTFGKPILEIFKGLGRNIKSFASLAENNKDKFLAFGDSLKNLVANILDFAAAFKEAFTKALPVITSIVNGLSEIVKMFSTILRGIASLGTFGAAIGMGGIAYGAMRGRRSAQIKSGRRSRNPQAAANAQFYEDTGGLGIPLMPSASMSQVAAYGQSGMLPMYTTHPYGRRQSLATLKKKAAAAGASKSSAYKKYAMQRMSGVGILSGMALAELGPRIFGQESATAMQIGGAISAFSPVVGAGVGLLGAGYSARTAKGGAGLGAAGGAMLGGKAGAMLGSVLPGIGTVGGALVGAAIGALAGGMIGAIRGGRAERKLSKELGGKFQASVFQNVTAALIAGDTGIAREMISDASKKAREYERADDEGRKRIIRSLGASGLLTPEEMKAASKHLDNFGKGFKDLQSNLRKAMEGPMKNFDELIRGVGSASGLTKEEIIDLARKMNVNLYDPTLKLQDAIVKLGAGMVKTAEELSVAMRDVLIDSTSVFEEIRKLDDTVSALAEAGERFRTGEVGDFVKSDFLDLLETSVSFVTQEFPNDPLAGLRAMIEMYGGPSGTAFATATGPLGRAGMYQQFVNTGGAAAFGKYTSQAFSGLGTQAFGNVGAQLASQGLIFQDPAMLQTLTTRLTQMSATDPLKAIQLLSELQNMDVQKRFGQTRGGRPAMARGLLNWLQSQGIDMGGIGIVNSAAGSSTISDPALQPLQESIISAINVGFDQKPEWWESYPGWWTGQMSGAPVQYVRDASGSLVPDYNGDGKPGDTRTSRLMRTMISHKKFDSAISGKRTVTSSLRDFNLGSPSSDHATGNAYDLTGQNLGLYSTMIKSAGGFAEFHGGGASRHLHVVPPAAPIGDRTNPVRVGPPTQSASGSVAGNVTVNVYGSENQNVKELAQIVISEINKAQRSSRERR